MRKYETLVLFSPELAIDSLKVAVDNFTGIIAREGGSVLDVDDWGMRELAYPVRKQMRGHYIRFEYVGKGDLVAELERNVRITDGVFKFVSVKLADEYKPAEA